MYIGLHARPTTPLTLPLVAQLPSPHPLWQLPSSQPTQVTESVTRLATRLDSHAGCQQVAARIDQRSSRPSFNDRKDNMRASSLKFSRTSNRILNTDKFGDKFSRVSRVSLTSLLDIQCNALSHFHRCHCHISSSDRPTCNPTLNVNLARPSDRIVILDRYWIAICICWKILNQTDPVLADHVYSSYNLKWDS